MMTIKAILFAGLLLIVTSVQANSDSAQLAFQARDYHQAKNLFEKQLEKNKEDIVAHLFMAKIAVKNENFELAEEHIKEAEELVENKKLKPVEIKIQAEIFYWFGTIMEMQAEKASIFRMSGYAKKSLKGYLKAIELSSENLEYRKGLINFYLEAPSLMGGDVDKAITHAKISFQQNPKFGYKMLINCYEESGDTQLMLTTYKLAIEQYPSDAELLFMRGSYWKSERKYENAVDDYLLSVNLPGTGIDHKATQLMSWYWIGRISGFEGKNLKRGIDAYQQVINFNEDIGDGFIPNNERTQFRMAKLMVLNGQKEAAKIIFTHLLSSTKHEDFKAEISTELN